jgi:hypothetical protein
MRFSVITALYFAVHNISSIPNKSYRKLNENNDFRMRTLRAAPLPDKNGSKTLRGKTNQAKT